MKTKKMKYTSKVLANNLAKLLIFDIDNWEYYGVDWDVLFDPTATDKDIVNAASKITIKDLRQSLMSEFNKANLNKMVKTINATLKEIQDTSKYNIQCELEMLEDEKRISSKKLKKELFIQSLTKAQKKAFDELQVIANEY
jgi:hypothetical protein